VQELSFTVSMKKGSRLEGTRIGGLGTEAQRNGNLRKKTSVLISSVDEALAGLVFAG